MKISRPHIIARKSILPAFKFRRIFFFLVFAALAAVIALMGNDIVASVEILNPIASFIPIIAAVFAVLAVIPLMGIIIRIIVLRHIYVEFYDTYVIKRRGVFNKIEEKCMFPKILSVNVYRSFWGRIFGYMFAMFLIGMTFLAIGIFVSSLTENQFAAALGTIGILLALMIVSVVNGLIDAYAVRAVLSWISIYSRYGNFTYGIFDFAAVVYYLSVAVVFLFLSVRVFEKRRWS